MKIKFKSLTAIISILVLTVLTISTPLLNNPVSPMCNLPAEKVHQ